MGRRQREWAKRARLALIAALGGRCVLCGAEECLTIEHVGGRNWDLRKKDQSWRLSVYRREAAEGRIAVLCLLCNAKDNRRYRDGRMSRNYLEIPEDKRTLLCIPNPDQVPF